MLKNFRVALNFLCTVCLGLSGTGFTDDRAVDSVIHKDEDSSSLKSSPLLTKQQTIDAFNAGIVAGATHMLIVWDTWDFEDSYQFFEYSYPDMDVNDLIEYYNAPGFYRVSAVLAMHLDINQQLSDKRWYPEYP